MTLRGPSPIDVFWHNTIASVPRTLPTLILGHEFLDALPIQKFQYTKKGWREILKEVLCPHNNLAATAMLGGLFEGEHVEQNVSRGESGTSSGASRS